MTNQYNDFGAMMLENRPTASQMDKEEFSTREWNYYLSICDKIATTAYAYLANGTTDRFPAFRSALHELFTFVGTDTRILSLDAYSIRFLPAVVPYTTVKSKAYKDAEKAVRAFKRAMSWAISVSDADPENPASVIFPKAADVQELEGHYFDADVQDFYNLCVPIFKRCMAQNVDMMVGDLDNELVYLQSIVDNLAAQPWQCYKDFKDPMKSSTGKILRHAPASIRKAIEDAMADLLTARDLMTPEQLAVEAAQIKGGRKAAKAAKNA